MQIAGRAAVGQISANENRIFGFDRDIEFPIADRRLRHRKIRTIGRRLRRGTPRQTDRNEIDVFQKLTC